MCQKKPKTGPSGDTVETEEMPPLEDEEDTSRMEEVD
jgi:hypothetical protein